MHLKVLVHTDLTDLTDMAVALLLMGAEREKRGGLYGNLEIIVYFCGKNWNEYDYIGKFTTYSR